MPDQKYFLDLNDLQYKQVRVPWKKRLFRIFLWLVCTTGITIIYGTVFERMFGSPKENVLNQQIENLKIQYTLASLEMENHFKTIESLKVSDEVRYRPILEMDSIPQSIRNPGFGGVERFRELNGYYNSSMMKSFRIRIEEMKNMTNIQTESFATISEMTAEWKDEMDHLPAISPVDPKYRMGDGFRFREVHPVLGYGRPHYGQDFYVGYGTKVYATGDGIVINTGRNSGGFGNVVVVDHGNGLQSYYAHLSEIRVPKGMNVKRGDCLGLSGNTGLSTGAHLHYQINKFNRPVNAIEFFNNDVTEEEFNEMIEAFSSKSIYR